MLHGEAIQQLDSPSTIRSILYCPKCVRACNVKAVLGASLRVAVSTVHQVRVRKHIDFLARFYNAIHNAVCQTRDAVLIGEAEEFYLRHV